MEDPQRFGLKPLHLATLEPFLRGLLLDDRVVTHTLGDHALAEVIVKIEEQREVAVDLPIASLLEVEAGSPGVRRRVSIYVGQSPTPTLLAESFVVAERLPPEVVASLATSGKGIGEVLDDMKVPTRRELVCLGASDHVPWRPRPDLGPAAVRLYRILANGLPAILIKEAFLVEVGAGQLRLGEPPPDSRFELPGSATVE